MSLWMLDTDHISLYLRGNQTVITNVDRNLSQVVMSIISFQEVMNGWTGALNQSDNTRNGLIHKYHQLWLASELFKALPILEFDAVAYDEWINLLKQNSPLQKKRLKQDVRIASIALANSATIVTRNRRDFELIPGLNIEDWSI
jgi:tRNA(fMet)-specific endonuclease VapC